MMNIQGMHYWPEPDFNFKNFLPSQYKVEDIEGFFADLYRPYKVLLFSSARVALKSILDVTGVTRPDLVWVMDYSSHCVFNAVSGIGTPITGAPDLGKNCIVYHQYGYQKKLTINLSVIEDSADSFITTSSALFTHESSKYEVISLPKVISAYFGGLVICKDQESYSNLKRVRDEGNFIPPALVGMLRVMKKFYRPALYLWEGSSIYSTSVSPFMVNDIYSCIEKWEMIKEIRLSNINYVEERLGMKLSRDRMPSAAMIPIDLIKPDILPFIGHLIRTVYSSDEISSNNQLKKCLLLPIHHEVDKKEINHFIDLTLK